jgi:hypothetical protein
MHKNETTGIEFWISFEYALMFITMYTSALSFASILHYAIDRYLSPAVAPTVISYTTFWGGDYLLRTAVAGIILSFPLFAYFFLDVNRRLLKTPALKNIPGKKQVTYITLSITFLVILAHTFTLLTQLLNVDVTARTIAHYLVTLGVAGSMFGYFLYDVRDDRKV